MIGWLKGRILQKAPPGILMEVQGVGYELEASMNTFCQLPDVGEEVSLYTHFLVREDAHRLFGFIHLKERVLFRRLIKISGIGAKVALAILSSMSPEDFVASVLNQDVSSFVRVPGIGKKTAERLLVEIKDSVSDWGSQALGDEKLNQFSVGAVQEAVEGLIALGYKPQEANKLIKKVQAPDLTSASLIRAALSEVAV